MAIEVEETLKKALDEFVIMTPDTDTGSATAVWHEQAAKGGVAYRNINSDIETYQEVSAILDLCRMQPEDLQSFGETLHNDNRSLAVRIDDYVIKLFKFTHDASAWERERRAGISAVRAAVMLEMGLTQIQDRLPIPVSVPALHAYLSPNNPTKMPAWVMAYEAIDQTCRVTEANLLYYLQGILDEALKNVSGERFVNTLLSENKSSNWGIKKCGGEISGLVKFGGSINPTFSSQRVWEQEARLFRI